MILCSPETRGGQHNLPGHGMAHSQTESLKERMGGVKNAGSDAPLLR
jgi:hypothetical protein